MRFILVSVLSTLLLASPSALASSSNNGNHDNRAFNSTSSEPNSNLARTSPLKIRNLPSNVDIAHIHDHKKKRGDHRALAEKLKLEKRKTYHGKGTYFYPGQGACGNHANSGDHITALATSTYSGGSYCGKRLRVINVQNGKSTTVVVQDACPGCAEGDLDLSPAAFKELGQESQGVLQISWQFV